MTFQTKNIVFAFAFAALMLAWPMSTPEVHAAGSAASLDENCPVDFPETIAFSNFVQGADDGEIIVAAMTTGGNKAGNLRIDAQDWKGDGQADDGSVTFEAVADTDIVIIDGTTYTGVAAVSTDNITFQANAGDATAATSLAESINAGAQAGDITATAILNMVLIVDDADGDNSRTLSTTDAPRVVISGANLEGGEAAGIVHMLAEKTKYSVTATGTAPTTLTSYASKTPLNSDAAGDKVVVGTTNIAQPVHFIFHISGDGTLINLPYSGALTQVLTVDVTCVAGS